MKRAWWLKWGAEVLFESREQYDLRFWVVDKYGFRTTAVNHIDNSLTYYALIWPLHVLLTECGCIFRVSYNKQQLFSCSTLTFLPGSSVVITTDYGLDGPGIESRWGRDFPPVQTGPGAHPASCTMGTASFPEVKSSRGVTLSPYPLLVTLVMKE